MNISPTHITNLSPNEIFVFGSNLAGIHGAGAARMAYKRFGAVYGIGSGPTGQCYAIPTKDERLATLRLAIIEHYVMEFLDYAQKHPDNKFMLTAVGCGLAGYTPRDIAHLFFPEGQTLDNVWYPKEFCDAVEIKVPLDVMLG